MTAMQALALAIQSGKRHTSLDASILQDPKSVVMYARRLGISSWPQGEAVVLQDAECAKNWARDIRKRRWFDAEPVILASSNVARAIEYASKVINGRWHDAEKLIANHPDESLHERYANAIAPTEMDEEWAAYCPCWLWTYSQRVSGGRLPEHLHNMMVGLGIKDAKRKNRFVKMYFDEI